MEFEVMVVREKNEELNKDFSKGMLRILDLNFLEVMGNYWYMCGKIIEYRIKDSKGRGCYIGERG